MMACEHAYDSMTGCARGGLLWNRAFGNSAYRALLFDIFFAAVINVVYTRFKADKDIMDALVHLKKKTGRRGEWKQPPETQP